MCEQEGDEARASTERRLSWNKRNGSAPSDLHMWVFLLWSPLGGSRVKGISQLLENLLIRKVELLSRWLCMSTGSVTLNRPLETNDFRVFTAQVGRVILEFGGSKLGLDLNENLDFKVQPDHFKLERFAVNVSAGSLDEGL